jgi:hypothetical protein
VDGLRSHARRKQGVHQRRLSGVVEPRGRERRCGFLGRHHIATVPQRPGSTNVQRLRGEPTGDVVEWKPGTDSFRVVPGTQLAGNNGIEIALDEREFYVVSFGTHTVVVFSRQDPLKPLRQSQAPGFMPDNLRWSGDRLIAAGPCMTNQPAGGRDLRSSTTQS